MKTTSHRLLALVSAVSLFAIGGFLAGCEKEDTVGGRVVDAVTNDSSSDSKASENLTGTWRGISGSGRSDTVVNLTDNNGALSGSLKWSWGGVRRFSGTRSGNSVQWTTQRDQQGVSDHWNMTLSSDRRSLTGHANKTDGGGYSISLSR